MGRGASSHRIDDLFPERSITFVEQQADVVSSAVCDDDVDVTIAVHIGCCQRVWRVSMVGFRRDSNRKHASARVKHHRDIVRGGIRDNDVEVAIAIEVVDC